MIDIEELKKLALAATPGPWIVQTGCSWRRIGTQGGDGDVLRPVKNQHDGWPDLAGPMENLQFIAAANPQAVLELLSKTEQLGSELAALRKELEREKIERQTFQHGYRIASDNCVRLEGLLVAKFGSAEGVEVQS